MTIQMIIQRMTAMKIRISNIVCIVFLVCFCFLFAGCELYSDDKNAPCTHEYKEISYKKPTCEQEGVKKEQCKLCKDIQETKVPAIGHRYEYKKCMDYRTCVNCGAKNDVFESHSTDNGYCSRCHQYYVSQESKLLSQEKQRYSSELDKLKSTHEQNQNKIDNKIAWYKGLCTYSKKECQSEVYTLNQQISAKESQMRRIGRSSLENDPTHIQREKMKIQSQISALVTKRSKYYEDLSRWNAIDSLTEQKMKLTDQYWADVKAENALHESNVAKINQSSKNK